MAKKSKDIQYYESVGRRKEAVATARLYIVGKEKSITVEGKKYEAGQIIVNGEAAEMAFPLDSHQKRYLQPIELTNNAGRFVITLKVNGGGTVGQLEAIIHAISRALNLVDKETFRPVLKANGLMTRDSRIRERRKVGHGGKARKKKQSPKR